MTELSVYRTKTFIRLSWRARFRLWWRRWRMPPELAALEHELTRRELDLILFGPAGPPPGGLPGLDRVVKAVESRYPAANPGALPPSPTRRP